MNDSSSDCTTVRLEWNRAQRSWDILEKPLDGEVVVWPIDQKGQERVWSLNHISALKNLSDLGVRISKGGAPQVYRRHRPAEGVLPRSWWDKKTYAAREYGTAALTQLFGVAPFSFAKSPFAVQDCLWVSGLANESDGEVLDYFAGSGTTGHAVINLNREDGGERKFILVEIGEYFDTVLLPRIKKLIFAPEWKDGKPKCSASSGEAERGPHVIKVIRLESYEDTLNNLELKRIPEQASLLEAEPAFREDYTLRYMLDVESRGSASLLNLDRFAHPFAYKLNIATGSVGETRPVAVDLVETFNYLLGLRVNRLRAVDGFTLVEGLSPVDEKVLVIWRDLAEKSNAALDAFFPAQGYGAREPGFDLVYANGDNNLENLKRPGETWKARLIEEEFLRLMFDVQDV